MSGTSISGSLTGSLILLTATFVWGTAFLAQKFGSESIGPFSVTCLRNALGGLFLLGCVAVRARTGRGSAVRPSVSASILAGVFSGLPLFAAMAAQQIGIGYTTPGISGFLTTNYMFIIPLLGIVIYRRFPHWHVWVGVVMALAGTYLICLSPEGGVPADLRSWRSVCAAVGPGELWTILCAFLFAIQMLVVDHYARRCDVLVMSSAQLFVASILAVPFLFLPSEAARLSFATLLSPRISLSLVYLGVFSSGIAYTLQNFAQIRTPPAVAGVILSTESVFAALSGFAVLGDRMTSAQLAGCALVLSAAVLTQVFESLRVRRSSSPAG